MTPFTKAWDMLKALPEHQMFLHEKPQIRNLANPNPSELAEPIPVGTVHPAIRGLLERRALEEEKKNFAGFHRGRSPEDFENFEPHHDVYDYDEEMLMPNLEVPERVKIDYGGSRRPPYNYDIQNRPEASFAHRINHPPRARTQKDSPQHAIDMAQNRIRVGAHAPFENQKLRFLFDTGENLVHENKPLETKPLPDSLWPTATHDEEFSDPAFR